MSGVLNGRVALVTGGESGIGAACAVALAEAGASVGITYHSREADAAAVRDKVIAAGQRAAMVQADVSDEASVEAAFDAVVAALGTIDLLINSAGLNQSGVAVADMSLEQWNRLIGTDLTGAFLTSRRLVRGLRAAKWAGRIVNISSIHAEVVRAGAADYDSAKGGLKNLTTTMALECAPLGITVNAIAPGMILTPMNARAQEDADYRASLEKNIPWGRAGTPEEVAALAVYLCSPVADYITGTTITIDGGLSLVLGQGA